MGWRRKVLFSPPFSLFTANSIAVMGQKAIAKAAKKQKILDDAIKV